MTLLATLVTASFVRITNMFMHVVKSCTSIPYTFTYYDLPHVSTLAIKGFSKMISEVRTQL